jgi:hypothetical protein
MKRVSWGTGLVIAMMLFVCVVATLVVIAIRQDVSLVQDQYYEAGQRYETRLRAMERAETLPQPLALDVSAGTVIIGFPHIGSVRGTTGTITLYRPSSRSMDRTIVVAPDSLWRQSFPVAAMEPGLWRIQVAWKADGMEYYAERPVVLQ